MAPELSDSPSIAKLSRGGSTLPARKVGWKRSATSEQRLKGQCCREEAVGETRIERRQQLLSRETLSELPSSENYINSLILMKRFFLVSLQNDNSTLPSLGNRPVQLLFISLSHYLSFSMAGL